jgi:hypothetical protein
MIQDLKADSAQWEAEKGVLGRDLGSSGPSGPSSYKNSNTHLQRQQLEPLSLEPPDMMDLDDIPGSMDAPAASGLPEARVQHGDEIFPAPGYGTASHGTRKPERRNDGSGTTIQKRQKASDYRNTLTSENKLLEEDDKQTTYLDAISTSDIRVQEYVSEVANDLFQMTSSTEIQQELFERQVAVLPRLLKALALAIGLATTTSSQMHRDVMFFIYKHRK